jgi:acetyl esterase/lipase
VDENYEHNQIIAVMTPKKFIFNLLFVFFSISFAVRAGNPEVIPLYPGAVPNNRTDIKDKETLVDAHYGVYANVTVPTLAIYRPDTPKARCAVIVIPGGSYAASWYGYQGTLVADSLSKKGITAFVLKYRIPRDEWQINKTIAPLQDAQRAMQYVRENAAKFNIDADKIGVMGFSAGGHLASTIDTHYTKALIDNPKGTSLRPDFAVLVYPVISMKKGIAHAESVKNLLGANPSADQIALYSNDLQVTDDTPPTFLTHATDDDGVLVENSILFYEAMLNHHRPVEMHLYVKGGHGFLGNVPSFDEWMGRCLSWLNVMGFLKSDK